MDEFNPETAQAFLRSIPDHYWPTFRASDVLAEQRRREAAPQIAEREAEIIDSLRDDPNVETPEVVSAGDMPPEQSAVPAWENPGSSITRAYMRGDIVSHQDRVWESQVQGANIWEPGGEGVHSMIWADVTDSLYPPTDDEGNPVVPDWVAPTGSHDAYNTGDRVTFEGQVYESKIDGNTWSPTDYPAGWEAIA